MSDLGNRLLKAALGIDLWLETTRQNAGSFPGYGGPVVHWWQNCLQYTGAGLDWRYEGIITGYLALYRASGDAQWLMKARRAGDDLVAGQLADGTYYSSVFEMNPYPGGTPHEAAADNGLLALANALKNAGDPDWERYVTPAQRNIDAFYIDRLWDAAAHSFRDHPTQPSFVPNKSATLSETLFALSALTGDERYAEVYALPTLDTLIAHQRGDGAVFQNSINGQIVGKIFPYYVARCIPALLQAYRWTQQQGSPQQRYLDAAISAGQFILNIRRGDGSLPQVIYEDGSSNLYLQWVAPLGDVLRGWTLLAPFGFTADVTPTLEWLLSGQLATGGIISGRGFGSQISQRSPPSPPDFRDLIVCGGWIDKAFRYLAEAVEQAQVDFSAAHFSAGIVEQECVVRGEKVMFYEDENRLELKKSKTPLYRWLKGSSWVEVCAPQLYWK